MSSFREQALTKLGAEALRSVTGNKERAMADAVREQLISFCNQDEEFAQAVAQGGTFSACMAAVAKGVGGSISDVDAYTKAVRFYFPGATVRATIRIDLIGDADTQQPEPAAAPTQTPAKPKGVLLDLSEFL